VGQFLVAVLAVNHRFEFLPVVGGAWRAKRPAGDFVALFLDGIARLELAGGKADDLAGLHGDLFAVLADLENRRAGFDVEDLFLVVMTVEAAGEGIARLEFEVVHREVLCSQFVRDWSAGVVDLQWVDFVAHVVDGDFLHVWPLRADVDNGTGTVTLPVTAPQVRRRCVR